MKKRMSKLAVTCMLLVVMLTGIVVNASEVRNIKKDEILPKSQFFGCIDLNNDGTIKGDLFAAGSFVSSIGTVEGDLVAGAKAVRSSGTVSGDIICAGKNVDISGKVDGDIRCGGENVVIGGNIGKNVNIFAGNATIKRDTQINGNILAFAEYIKIEGKVKGYTKIYGKSIILSGEFFGDVDINLGIPDTMNLKHGWKEDIDVTVLSGTVIHGKLTYKTPKKAHIESDVHVEDSQWIEVKDLSTHSQLPDSKETAHDLLKLLLSTSVYFLLAMLLFKMLPNTFKYQGDLIARKPFKIMGIGFIGIVSILGALIMLIILIVLSVFFKTPMPAVIFGLLSMVFYAAVFYLAAIPVSIWLGNIILKNRYNIPARFAVGLGIISVTKFMLNYFKNLTAVGPFFGFLSFMTMFIIILTGMGALLVTVKDMAIFLRRVDGEPREPVA
ncbi:polymer-forming cytoskeletal protein [Candidatus Desantisbacteria bacterium]|nr:polymer-forming cytoskeletal protein [Candidatus Desantisbacteria bacterium]